MIMKLKKFIIIILMTLVASSTFASAGIIKTGNTTPNDNSNHISSMDSDVLTPPWSEHAGWCDKWTELCGESKGYAKTTPYDGEGYACAESSFFGKAQTRTIFYHQTNVEDYTIPVSGRYDFVFTYEYDGFLNFELYHHPWFDLYFEYEISILFNMYIEGNQDPYVEKVTLEKGEYSGAGFEEKDLEGTIDYVFKDIYVTKGKYVLFTAKVDIFLYAATGAWGLIKSEAKLNGKLKRITITDEYCDSQPPVISINKPEKAFYFRNKRRASFPIPFVLGRIDIEVNALDSGTGIEKVEFYINGDLKNTDYYFPYEWNWNERRLCNAKIDVIAYDYSGNIKEDNIPFVRYINPWGE